MDQVPESPVSIEELPRERLDELAPLWDALRVHHLAIGDDWLPPARTANDSWRRRRAHDAEARG